MKKKLLVVLLLGIGVVIPFFAGTSVLLSSQEQSYGTPAILVLRYTADENGRFMDGVSFHPNTLLVYLVIPAVMAFVAGRISVPRSSR